MNTVNSREIGSDFVNVAPLQLGEEVLWIHGRLLVSRCRLGFGNEFLKTWIIPDWIPDGIDFQARNGNDLTSWESDQLAKDFYRVLGPAGARFDFGQSSKKIRAGKRIFLDRQ